MAEADSNRQRSDSHIKMTSANDLGRPFSQNYDDCEDPKLTEQGFKEDGPLEQLDEAEWTRFSAILFSFLLLLLILFGTCVEYGHRYDITSDMQYLYYLNVTVMMLIGFGFLMTFMRKFSLSAVGFTFLITAICIPWCILTGRFFASITSKDDSAYPGINNDGSWNKIQLNINALLQGNFAAAAVLISFGALLGKLTPSQTVVLAILEVPIYSFNKEVSHSVLQLPHPALSCRFWRFGRWAPSIWAVPSSSIYSARISVCLPRTCLANQRILPTLSLRR